MAKRKVKTNGRKKQFTLPVSIVAGFGVGLGRLANDWIQYKDINIVTREFGQFYTGYDWTTGQWNFSSLKFGLMPVVIGMLIHKIAGRLGINRALSSAGVPIVRL